MGHSVTVHKDSVEQEETEATERHDSIQGVHAVDPRFPPVQVPIADTQMVEPVNGCDERYIWD